MFVTGELAGVLYSGEHVTAERTRAGDPERERTGAGASVTALTGRQTEGEWKRVQTGGKTQRTAG